MPVTAAGTSTVTHTVAATARMRIGDSLYFAGAAVFRTITAIPTATTVTVEGAVFSTVLREPVTVFPAGLDLATAVAAGIDAFERDTGRKFLATGDTTRNFDLPTNSRGMLDFKADLSALTSLAIQGTAYTLNTDFRLLAEDADEEGLPWTRVQFARRWIFPLEWTNVRVIAIVGRWAYASSSGAGMPEGAWTAMLYAGVLMRLPQIAARATRGVVSWGEADVNESYGQQPLGGLVQLWQAQLCAAVARYHKVTVG
mgnify:FL=1